jgi:hypothetical protein
MYLSLLGNNAIKCEQYWAENVHEKCTFSHMEIQTEEIIVSNMSEVLIRKLTITSMYMTTTQVRIKILIKQI